MPLNSVEVGEGQAVVLIHGLFGSSENLGLLARSLSESFRVFALDLPNHGRSLHVDDCDLDAMADLVLAWMDEQDLPSAALVGHSLGGKVAMQIALRFSERVTSLAVMDISPDSYEPHHHPIFESLLALKLSNIASRRDADRVLKHRIEEPKVRSFLLKNLARSSEGHFTWRMNLSALHRCYPRLIRENDAREKYVGPTLFLKGGASNYIREAHRKAIVSRFPHATLKIVANAGHWLHAEKPELVATLIKKFLHNQVLKSDER